MPDIDIGELLPNITSPTLALAGENDPIVPPEQSRIIAERVPKGENVFLKGTGHLPMFEQQNEYDRVLTDIDNKTFGSFFRLGQAKSFVASCIIRPIGKFRGHERSASLKSS